jgi:hypothetical protein
MPGFDDLSKAIGISDMTQLDELTAESIVVRVDERTTHEGASTP